MQDDRFSELISTLASPQNDHGSGGAASGGDGLSHPELRRLPDFEAAVGAADGVAASAWSPSPVSGSDLSAGALALQELACTFPIAGVRGRIRKSFAENRVTVICGDTGSGKTTQVPQLAAEFVWSFYIHSGEWLGQVLMALPTRAGTEAEFWYVCGEADVWPGELAGCRTRARKDGEKTASMLFLTQGYLVRLVHNGIIQRAAVVILDETQTRRQ